MSALHPEPSPLLAAELEPPRDPATGIDLSLLALHQAMTVEERWQMNEAALALIDELRDGMAGNYAQSC